MVPISITALSLAERVGGDEIQRALYASATSVLRQSGDVSVDEDRGHVSQ